MDDGGGPTCRGVLVVAAGVPEERDRVAWEGLSGVALGWMHRGWRSLWMVDWWVAGGH